MKIKLILILFCNLIFYAFDCAGQQKFQLTSLTGSSSSLNSISHSLSGGFISLGESNLNSTGQIVLSKKLSDHSSLWETSLYSQDSAIKPSVFTECQDRSILVAAKITEAGTSAYPASDILLIKTTETGQILWSHRINNFHYDEAKSIVEMADGSIIIASKSAASSLNPVYNISLIHCDSAGNFLWSKSIAGNGDDIPSNMIMSSDDNLIMCGSSNSFTAGSGFFLSKIDTAGNYIWFKTYFTGFQDSCHGLIQTNDGGYLMIGEGGINGDDILLIKTDQDGLFQTAHSYNLGFGSNSNVDKGIKIAGTGDGGYALSGESYLTGSSLPFLFLLKLSGNFVVEWYNTYGFQLTNKFSSLLQMPDGGFVLGGARKFPGSPIFRNLLIKTDSTGDSGCLQTILDLTEQIENTFSASATPTTFVTSSGQVSFPLTTSVPVFSIDTSCSIFTNVQNAPIPESGISVFPNPFSDELNLRIDDLQNISAISILLMDNTGRILDKEINSYDVETGTINLQLPELSPGIYHLVIKKVDGTTQNKKLVCIR